MIIVLIPKYLRIYRACRLLLWERVSLLGGGSIYLGCQRAAMCSCFYWSQRLSLVDLGLVALLSVSVWACQLQSAPEESWQHRW